MGALRDEQLQELEALISVFDGDRVKFEEGPGAFKGSIQIEFEEPSVPVEVSVSDNGVEKSVRVAVLPPATLLFSLPVDYPSTSCPDFSIECIWMSGELIDSIRNTLKTEAETMLGMPTLFFCCQAMVKFIRELHLTHISLNDTPFIIQKNLLPSESLRLVSETSEQAEEHKFELACYDCEICFDNKTGRECARITPCNHVYCLKCVAGYVHEKTRGSKMVGAITCLGDGCESILAQNLIKRSIGEEEFERYERIVLETALWQMADVVSCPRPTCQKSVILNEANPRLGWCHCGYAFCVLCKKTYHGVDDCANRKLPRRVVTNPDDPTGSDFTYSRDEIVEKWTKGTEKERLAMAKWYGGYGKLQELVDTVQNEDWIENNSKFCPKCGAAIEKDQGCNKMMCTKCKSPFCWLCNKLLPKGNPYSHFKEGKCANRLFEGTYEEEQPGEEEGEEEDEDDHDFFQDLFQ